MNEVEKVAEAVSESAKFGTQALQTGEKVGSFVARVLKEPFETGASIVNDRLKLMRLRQLDKMADEVQGILRRRGITDTRAVPPKVGIPLLEHATLEEEPELQELWSRLLANAMDPNFEDEVRVAYTEIIKSLTSLDARILRMIYNSLHAENRLDFSVAEQTPFSQGPICTALNISPEAYLLSIDNLIRVRCVAPYAQRIKLGKGIKTERETHLSALARPGDVTITALGIGFVQACGDGEEAQQNTVNAGNQFNQTIDVTPDSLGFKAANIS